jgi:hypothetical protein
LCQPDAKRIAAAQWQGGLGNPGTRKLGDGNLGRETWGGKPGETWGQTGRSPVFRISCNRGDAELAGVHGRPFGPASFSGSQRTRCGFLQARNELGTPQRTTGVRRVPQGTQLRCRVCAREEILPSLHRPSTPPALHFQHRVRIRESTVRGCARPRPLFGTFHYRGAYRIQLNVTQRDP